MEFCGYRPGQSVGFDMVQARTLTGVLPAALVFCTDLLRSGAAAAAASPVGGWSWVCSVCFYLLSGVPAATLRRNQYQ